jgi:hypothetical protein
MKIRPADVEAAFRRAHVVDGTMLAPPRLGSDPSPVPLPDEVHRDSGARSPQGRGLLIQLYPRCPAKDVGHAQLGREGR